jgi:membrane-bound inhibitor of C-type lysozyme
MIKRVAGLFAGVAFIAGLMAGASAQSPSPAMPPVPKKVKTTYRCSGLKVVAYYDNVKNRVAFVYGSKHYALPHVQSADGARYLGSGLEWWEKGPNVTLSSVAAGGTSGDTVLANCVAVAK